jgi:hypothetical protein
VGVAGRVVSVRKAETCMAKLPLSEEQEEDPVMELAIQQWAMDHLLAIGN